MFSRFFLYLIFDKINDFVVMEIQKVLFASLKRPTKTIQPIDQSVIIVMVD